MCGRYCDNLQEYFGAQKIQLPGMDTDGFVLGVNTVDIAKDIQNLKGLFDFSNVKEIMNFKVRKKNSAVL